jgi:hypothetical protein
VFFVGAPFSLRCNNTNNRARTYVNARVVMKSAISLPFLQQGLTEEEADMARDEYVDALMNGEDNETQLAEHWSQSPPPSPAECCPCFILDNFTPTGLSSSLSPTLSHEHTAPASALTRADACQQPQEA